jgi:mannosyl-3-phosphoglycerate phosphatase
MQSHWLVFTDLDGTLLDHDSYDFSPALPAIDRLKHLGIPIIPVSSKTLAELEDLVARLHLDGPVIAENGSVIRIPGQPPSITPPNYAAIRNLLSELRKTPEFRLTGFGDMRLDEVVAATGLSTESARLAMRRLASEPILWEGSTQALDHFRDEVTSRGLRMLQGGRFIHLLGDTDKGRAVRRVIDWFRAAGHNDILSVALGDSDNDIDMLTEVDIPVIIRKKDGSHLELAQREAAIITRLAGPAGWNQALNNLLNEHGRH